MEKQRIAMILFISIQLYVQLVFLMDSENECKVPRIFFKWRLSGDLVRFFILVILKMKSALQIAIKKFNFVSFSRIFPIDNRI